MTLIEWDNSLSDLLVYLTICACVFTIGLFIFPIVRWISDRPRDNNQLIRGVTFNSIGRFSH